MLKDLLHTPYSPPAECLHVFANVLPMHIYYKKMRLALIKQLLYIDCTSIHGKQKSVLSLKLKTEMANYLGNRNWQPEDIIINTFTKSKINKHIANTWKSSFARFCKRNGASDGLMNMITDPHTLLSTNRIPLHCQPKFVGGLCALLTGHARLQQHLYRLKLTYSPVCVCLGGDESPYHFLFECELNRAARNFYRPNLDQCAGITNMLPLCYKTP